MKTAVLKINLYEFKELSEEAKERAISEHYDFLRSESFEAQDENGNVSDDEGPTEEEVQESIEENEYFFYENGKLAHTVKYTGGHPLTGLMVFKSKGQKVFI